MYEELRKKVREGNQRLVQLGLVNLTFGNLSAIDCEVIGIKPSGVDYSLLKDEDIVVLNKNGELINGNKKPSLDTFTHLELYNSFNGIGAVIHTHSKYATCFAQAKKPITCLGTTHADHFNGDIPITRDLTDEEITHDYEKNTGKVIVETFNKQEINPLEIPACLVANHGPFVWGRTIEEAIENAVILELISKMNLHTLDLNPLAKINPILRKAHYERKHGKNAYYGQV
mgnify:CR=1 FL=1